MVSLKNKLKLVLKTTKIGGRNNISNDKSINISSTPKANNRNGNSINIRSTPKANNRTRNGNSKTRKKSNISLNTKTVWPLKNFNLLTLSFSDNSNYRSRRPP